tara:strand:+ start:836 stop:1582 length:747 start_codon:yes stop_codon:yes gene_type:complete
MDVYSNLNKLFGPTNYYNYMNHGYYPSYTNLNGYHRAFKHQASLYLYLFDNIATKNKKLLEVGCGRGGGINLLSNHFDFKSIEACDLNKLNIKHCTKYSKSVGFKISNAEHLEYNDDQFDIVLNVESSHCYNHLEKFYAEVRRVLKKNGVFLYTDIFIPAPGGKLRLAQSKIYDIEQALNKFFKEIKREDITNHVASACEKDIENFDKILPDGEIKTWSIDLVKKMKQVYRDGEYKYFKYVACKRMGL